MIDLAAGVFSIRLFELAPDPPADDAAA